MSQTNTQPTGTPIRTSVKKSAITLDKISTGEFQKDGTVTAQIRQVVETKSFYPNKRIDSNLQHNIFGLDDFGFGEQEFDSTETRVAFILVPALAKEADIKAKLIAASANDATIYKVLSNHPILDDNQKYAIAQSLRTMDDFANTQVIRFPKEHEKAGQLILDKAGKVQYRRTFFWNAPMDTQDARTSDPADVYLSAEIKVELQGASVLQGQTI